MTDFHEEFDTIEASVDLDKHFNEWDDKEFDEFIHDALNEKHPDYSVETSLRDWLGQYADDFAYNDYHAQYGQYPDSDKSFEAYCDMTEGSKKLLDYHKARYKAALDKRNDLTDSERKVKALLEADETLMSVDDAKIELAQFRLMGDG